MVRPQPRRAPKHVACSPVYSWFCEGPTDPHSSRGVERLANRVISTAAVLFFLGGNCQNRAVWIHRAAGLIYEYG